ATFEHHGDGSTRIPTGHPEDGCYMRAHLWALQMRQAGVDTQKVFVARDSSLTVNSANALGGTDAAPRQVTWNYHVAPLVQVDLGNGGRTVPMVLDPALGLGPVPVDTWIGAMGVNPGDYTINTAGDVPPGAVPQAVDPNPGADARVTIASLNSMMSAGNNVTLLDTVQDYDKMNRRAEDTLRDYSLEMQRREEFRTWHDNTADPAVQQSMRELYPNLHATIRPYFHEAYNNATTTEERTQVVATYH
ncbi:protein-glutamine glutaminase family protein, partial [Umezawaea beigongshangensis]|uniref:protein-glutamine glutaminase family protein n=1 Tax=Umezawaea beigongshangensis TaxID=2780383 RepID=UPI0018F1CD1E